MSRPPRRGATMIELSAAMIIIALVMAVGVAGLSLLKAPAVAPSEPIAIDRACDHLRRDLAAGGRVDGGALLAGAVRWDLVGGELRRDGLCQLRVRSAGWRRDGRCTIVDLAPIGQPMRTVRVTVPDASP
jgi:prepilin-type N-terminal cleavage/methylation domain-containing protein